MNRVSLKYRSLLSLKVAFAIGFTSFAGSAVFLPNEASAQSKMCRALSQRLNSIPAGFGPSSSEIRRSSKYREADSLVKRQRRALRAANRDFRAFDCDDDGSASVCRPLGKKIVRMENNLHRLSVARDRLLDDRGAQRKRARAATERRIIQRRMRELNCHAGGEVRSAAIVRKKKKRGFFERLFGSNRTTRSSRYAERNRPGFDDPQLSINSGVFRTLCVRVCDGYYFPVSFATTESNFAADDAICQASNTNTDMRLFFHLNPGEESEDMVDLTGRAYTELPNAFRYRQEFVGEDICPAPNKPSNFTTVAGVNGDPDILPQPALGQTEQQQTPEEIVTPAPSTKPDFFNDPDTDLARIGQFELRPVNEIDIDGLTEEVARVEYDPNQIEQDGIRVIGPTFLADREAVELLQAPDHVRVQ